jgi:sulfite reductase alpha subunit-like flavoprotein
MNLLERLSPEHLEMLKVQQEKYPTTIKTLIAALEDNNHFLDLSYQNILNLYMHLDLRDYSISSVEKLFDNVSS